MLPSEAKAGPAPHAESNRLQARKSRKLRAAGRKNLKPEARSILASDFRLLTSAICTLSSVIPFLDIRFLL